jgi:hypothetical protein
MKSKWAMTALRERRLKVSLLTDLNDPFECLPLNFSAHPTLRGTFHDTKQGWASIFGVVCFSRSWNDPVLWAHYADAHKGICLGFDVPDHLLKEAVYIPKPMTLNELMACDFDVLYRAKAARWQYEDEVRMIVQLGAPAAGGHHFVPMDGRLRLTDVILGCRCSVAITDIAEALSKHPKGVRVCRCAPAEDSFDMVEGEVLM